MRRYLLEVKPVRKVAPNIGQIDTFYVADGNVDTTLNGKLWRAGLVRPFTMRAEASAGDDRGERPLGGDAKPSFGPIELANGDRRFDVLVKEYAWYGVDYTLYVGTIGDAWPWTTLHKGWIADLDDVDHETIRFLLRDFSEILDRPVQDNLFPGGGGHVSGLPNGTDDLKGKPRPILIGRIIFREPVLVDEHDGTAIYQVHDGTMNLIGVYERGLEYGAGSYFDDVSDVYAWTPVPGRVARDNAQGVFRLPVPPVGIITVDAEATDIPDEAGVGASHANAILFALQHAGVLASGDLDLPSFEDLHDAEAVQIGVDPRIQLHITEPRTIAEVVDEILGSAGALRTWTADRKLRVRQVAFGSPVATIGADRVLGDGPRRIRTAPPIWRITYRHNRIRALSTDELTPAIELVKVPSSGDSDVLDGDRETFRIDLSAETEWSSESGAYVGRRVTLSVNPATPRDATILDYDVAAGIATVTLSAKLPANLDNTTDVRILAVRGLGADIRTYLQQEYRTGTVQNATTLTHYPRARDVIRTFLHDLGANALTEAGRHRSLESFPRDTWVVRVWGHFLTFALGDTVTFAYPRFGLDAGKNFLVLGIEEDAETERTELTLWGPSA